MRDAIFRGIMIGGSMGILATVLFEMNPPRAFALGAVCGIMAGLTKYFVEKKRK